jgi:hypothetical protein
MSLYYVVRGYFRWASREVQPALKSIMPTAEFSYDRCGTPENKQQHVRYRRLLCNA